MIDISIYLLPLVLAASALMRLPENPILAPHRQILISIFWFSTATVQDVDIFRYIYDSRNYDVQSGLSGSKSRAEFDGNNKIKSDI